MIARVLDPHHSTRKWTIHCNQPVAASLVAPRDVLKLVFHEGPCLPPRLTSLLLSIFTGVVNYSQAYLPIRQTDLY